MIAQGQTDMPPPAPSAASIKKRAYAASAYERRPCARPGGRRRGRGWASSNSAVAAGAVPQVTARIAYHRMRRVQKAEEVKLKVKDA